MTEKSNTQRPRVQVASLREGFPSSGLVALSELPVELPFAAGAVIAGKYEVLKLIGSGGMGYVVSAMHVELGEVVALKFLRPEALAIEELVERFAREARAAAKIRSEHIARVFDVGTMPDGVPFIVMEHLAGRDLAAVLHEQGPLPIKVAVEYMMQACEALAAAHASGVIHRDIKPENLFLTRHAQGMDFIKILDFGISKVALTGRQPGKRAFVRTMMPLGSPVYMSPEQIRSAEQVDARTDIWSLGCVLFELLTGVVAFDEPSLMQLSAAILEHDPVPLRELLPEAPVELEDVVLRCLEKDPDKRYANIAELALALYPFAPRRSRISAERCYHALKNAGISCPDFEITSVFPPYMGGPASAPNGPSSTQPSLTGLRTSVPELRTSVPKLRTSVPKLRTSVPELRTSVPKLRTSSPSALETTSDTSGENEFGELRPRRYKLFGVLALSIAGALGGYLLLGNQPSDAASAPLGAEKATAAPQVLTKAAAQGATPVETVSGADLAVTAPSSPPAAGEKGSLSTAPSATTSPSSAAKAQANSRRVRVAAPQRKRADDELDVGY